MIVGGAGKSKPLNCLPTLFWPAGRALRSNYKTVGRIHSEVARAHRLWHRINANTNQNVGTSGCRRDTELKPTGGGRQGTHLPCRRCSANARTCKASGRPCGETNRRAGIGCEGRTGRGSSLAQARDPRQRRISWTHPRGRTFPSIMA